MQLTEKQFWTVAGSLGQAEASAIALCAENRAEAMALIRPEAARQFEALVTDTDGSVTLERKVVRAAYLQGLEGIVARLKRRIAQLEE